jgi:hypothetical protein
MRSRSGPAKRSKASRSAGSRSAARSAWCRTGGAGEGRRPRRGPGTSAPRCGPGSTRWRPRPPACPEGPPAVGLLQRLELRLQTLDP